MSGIERLVVSAAVGTAARPVDPAALPQELRPPEVEGRTPGATLLEAAALHAMAARASAGLVDGAVEPPVLAAETRAVAGRRWTTAFRQALGSRSTEVVVEALVALARQGMRLPHAVVVDVLAMPVPVEFRGRVPVDVLGVRGRWLQSHEPFGTWALAAPATDPDDDVWDTGTTAERATWLGRLHRNDPDRARALLDEVWEGEDRTAREALLGALGPSLTAADDALLERALDDRAAGVRTLAQALVPGVPGTAYAARMTERMAGLVRRGLLGRVRVDLDGLAADARDGIPDPAKDCDRALARIVEGVPLDRWFDLTGRVAAALVGREVADGVTLDRGLAAAAVRARDVEVCDAIAAAVARSLSHKDARPDAAELEATRLASGRPRTEAVLAGLSSGNPFWLTLLEDQTWPEDVVAPVLHALVGRETRSIPRALALLVAHGDVTGRIDLADQVRQLAAAKDFPQAQRSRAYAAAMNLDLRRTLVLELKEHR
ncbi:DUF5691 domain-containing protein [Mariniluteicoccus flavus]